MVGEASDRKRKAATKIGRGAAVIVTRAPFSRKLGRNRPFSHLDTIAPPAVGLTPCRAWSAPSRPSANSSMRTRTSNPTDHNAVGRFPEPGDDELLAGPARNFQVFDPLDFLAEVTQHIPDPGSKLLRDYGWYSHKTRGQRTQRETSAGAGTGIAARSPTAREARKGWATLIKQVYGFGAAQPGLAAPARSRGLDHRELCRSRRGNRRRTMEYEQHGNNNESNRLHCWSCWRRRMLSSRLPVTSWNRNSSNRRFEGPLCRLSRFPVRIRQDSWGAHDNLDRNVTVSVFPGRQAI